MKTNRTWIQSYTGRQVFPLALQPDQVCVADVAHALSNKCRYTGHSAFFYSVAQHCVLGAQALPSAFQLAFLLHEVSEVYLPDVATPVKGALLFCTGTDPEGDPLTMTWSDLEDEHARVVLEGLGLSSILPLLTCAEVKEMDLRMLLTEKARLHKQEPASWELPDVPLADVMIYEVDPRTAERLWLDLFYKLTGRVAP